MTLGGGQGSMTLPSLQSATCMLGSGLPAACSRSLTGWQPLLQSLLAEPFNPYNKKM